MAQQRTECRRVNRKKIGFNRFTGRELTMVDAPGEMTPESAISGIAIWCANECRGNTRYSRSIVAISTHWPKCIRLPFGGPNCNSPCACAPLKQTARDPPVFRAIAHGKWGMRPFRRQDEQVLQCRPANARNTIETRPAAFPLNTGEMRAVGFIAHSRIRTGGNSFAAHIGAIHCEWSHSIAGGKG